MPKKKKRSNKNKLNYEISNEFGMNNGPEEINSKTKRSSRKNKKRNCK